MTGDGETVKKPFIKEPEFTKYFKQFNVQPFDGDREDNQIIDMPLSSIGNRTNCFEFKSLKEFGQGLKAEGTIKTINKLQDLIRQ